MVDAFRCSSVSTLFTLASLACAYAPNLEWLIGARFVQALGGCAGMVISRAVVSDKCDAVGSAKVFSQLMLVMGLAPILAPMLGGLLVNTTGWQSIFLVLTGFSALAGLAVALGLPESMPAHMPRQPLSGALRQYGRLLKDRVYLGHALTGGIAIAGMFAYIAGSPFIFIKLYGVPAEHFGWLFGTNAAGFILVAQVNARLLAKRGPAFLLSRAVWVYLAAGLTLLAVSALHTESLVAAADSIVHLRVEPRLHQPQRRRLRDERAGRARRQRFGVARLHAIQRRGRRFGAGGGVARWHGRADGDRHQHLRFAGGVRRDAHPTSAKRPGAGASSSRGLKPQPAARCWLRSGI